MKPQPSCVASSPSSHRSAAVGALSTFETVHRNAHVQQEGRMTAELAVVAGATGSLGSAIARRLTASGLNVLVVAPYTGR